MWWIGKSTVSGEYTLVLPDEILREYLSSNVKIEHLLLVHSLSLPAICSSTIDLAPFIVIQQAELEKSVHEFLHIMGGWYKLFIVNAEEQAHHFRKPPILNITRPPHTFPSIIRVALGKSDGIKSVLIRMHVPAPQLLSR